MATKPNYNKYKGKYGPAFDKKLIAWKTEDKGEPKAMMPPKAGPPASKSRSKAPLFPPKSGTTSGSKPAFGSPEWRAKYGKGSKQAPQSSTQSKDMTDPKMVAHQQALHQALKKHKGN